VVTTRRSALSGPDGHAVYVGRVALECAHPGGIKLANVIDSTTIAFLGVAIVIVVVPGPDMALVARNTIGYGRRAGRLTVLGVMCGICGWAIAAAAGIATLLAASAAAFTVVKLLGAIYLVGLGLVTLRHLDAPVEVESPDPTAGRRSLWLQGFLSAGLNPKLGVFFVTLLPQFIAPSDPAQLRSFELAGLFALVGMVWLLVFTELVARASGTLRRRRPMRALRAVSGMVLVGLGLRLAVSER